MNEGDDDGGGSSNGMGGGGGENRRSKSPENAFVYDNEMEYDEETRLVTHIPGSYNPYHTRKENGGTGGGGRRKTGNRADGSREFTTTGHSRTGSNGGGGGRNSNSGEGSSRHKNSHHNSYTNNGNSNNKQRGNGNQFQTVIVPVNSDGIEESSGSGAVSTHYQLFSFSHFFNIIIFVPFFGLLNNLRAFAT